MCSTPPAMATSYAPKPRCRRRRGHRGHRARAHAVDGEAGDGLGQPGEQRGGAADGQALVADLRGRRDRDLVDALRRQLGLRRSSSRMQRMTRSSARVSAYCPVGLPALPNGVRTPSTKTTSDR
jgi:hypothetical protein